MSTVIIKQETIFLPIILRSSVKLIYLIFSGGRNNMELDDSQVLGFETIRSAVEMGRFGKHILIQGAAGTGKSTLIKTVIYSLRKIGHPISVTALTNRATNKLRDDLSGVCPANDISTTGRLFGFAIDQYGHINLRGSRPKLKEGQVIFIDECGMQSAEVTKLIVEIAGWCKCLLVMTGDPYQIPYIKNGRYIESPIFSSDDFYQVILSNNYRQVEQGDKSLASLSNSIRTAIDGGVFPDLYSFANVERKQQASFIEKAVEKFSSGMSVKIILIGGEDNDIDGINRHVKSKSLPGQAQSAFQVGEMLITMADMPTDQGYITKDTDLIVKSVSSPKKSSINIKVNDYVCQSLIDGQLVKFSAAFDIKEAVAKQRELRKELEQAGKTNDNLRKNNIRKKINDYQRFAAPVNSAYAVSVFSAQGSTYDHVFLKLAETRKKLDKQILLRMIYVAVTRARKSLTITGSLREDL